MRPIEDILPRVMPRVPGAAEPVVLDAIRRAAQELCETTRLWRYTDTFASVADEELLAAPHEAEIFEIESARFDGQILEPASLAWLDENVPDWRNQEGNGPHWITQTNPDSVAIVPRSVGTLAVTLTLKPSDQAETLPDWLVAKYARVLADGALADLMVMPAQDYSNPSLAGVHSQRFQSALDRLASQGYQGQQRAPKRTTTYFF